MKYTDVCNNPKKFLALTGIKIALSHEIFPWFEEENNLYLRYHDISGKKRSGMRAGAIYANSPLSTVADTGYQGYRTVNAMVMQPTKKPKGGELTPEQKAENRNIFSRRIRVEHSVGDAKLLRIIKGDGRLRANNYVGRIFHIAAGIHNWRMSTRN